MKESISKFENKINSSLECFDRVVFKLSVNGVAGFMQSLAGDFAQAYNIRGRWDDNGGVQGELQLLKA